MPRTPFRFSSAACTALLAAATLVPATDAAAQTIPDHEVQMAGALAAAPPELRAGAAIIGWRSDGTTVRLRDGDNGLICLADDPTREGWSPACYQESLEPYMERGRQLRLEGVSDAAERLRIRWAEADAGTLALPEEPAMVYILAGDGFDASAGQPINPFLRWVVYIPYATPESTGLPTRPTSADAPWLMYPGEAGAHIMITPARSGGG